jgi:hypothetical protein
VVTEAALFLECINIYGQIRKKTSPDTNTKKELVYVHIASPEFKKK